MRYSTIGEVRDRFLGKLENVKAVGKGWEASCPVPEHGQGRGDRDPSLKIDERPDRLLIHCHGGCSPEQVVEVLGLTMADLFVRNDVVVPFDPESRRQSRAATSRDEAITLESYAAFTGL